MTRLLEFFDFVLRLKYYIFIYLLQWKVEFKMKWELFFINFRKNNSKRKRKRRECEKKKEEWKMTAIYPWRALCEFSQGAKIPVFPKGKWSGLSWWVRSEIEAIDFLEKSGLPDDRKHQSRGVSIVEGR